MKIKFNKNGKKENYIPCTKIILINDDVQIYEGIVPAVYPHGISLIEAETSKNVGWIGESSIKEIEVYKK